MSRILPLLLLFLLISACTSEEKKEIIDVSGIDVNFKVDRFEQAFYTANSSNFEALKKEYPTMLSSEQDSVWLRKIANKDEQHLYAESQRVFGDFKDVKNELESLFKHIKYYNPKFRAPNVVTHISNVDYKYPVIYNDSLLFVALDMYLGKENDIYSEFPAYLKHNYEKENVVVDAAKDIVAQSFTLKKGRTFLDRMITEGKFMYLIDSYLPSISDANKMNYSKEKMAWATVNEINIWKYFVENELLFSNDAKLNIRFMNVAPFSKFYMDFDQQSPGRIGVWIGLQIVRSYMKNNDVTLQQLLATSPEEIYKKSKYKPRR